MKTKKSNLDKMCYTIFVGYLRSMGIEYTERQDVDIDFWMESYTAVKPLDNNLKERFFSNDGGWQLFD